VTPDVFRTAVAFAVAIKARQRICTASLEDTA